MSLYPIDPEEEELPYAPASTPYNEAPWCDYDDDVEIFCGRSPHHLCIEISATLLKHHSRYFKNLIEGPAFRDFIRLPGEDPHIFALVHSFLSRRMWFDPPASAEAWAHISFDNMVQIWLMGHRLDMPFVQNAISDLLVLKIKKMKEMPDTSCLAFAWTGTPSGSPLRRLLVNLIRQCWTGDCEEYYSDLWTNDLMNGIGSEEDIYPLMCNLIRLAERDHATLRVTDKMWKRVKGCEWHVHEEFVTCEDTSELRLPDQRMEFNEMCVKKTRDEGWIYLRVPDDNEFDW